MMFKVIVCILISYFLGNISGGMILEKLLFNKDIREFGSKNAGTTNAIRVFGAKAGILTFLIDFFKAMFACYIGMKLLGTNGILLAGIFVVLGHNWPIILNFKGGKGIASSFGFIVFFDYKIALVAITIFIVIVLFTRYISLGSIISPFSSIPMAFLLNYREIEVYLTLIFLSLLSLYRHKANIKRLIDGNENKISVGKSKKT